MGGSSTLEAAMGAVELVRHPLPLFYLAAGFGSHKMAFCAGLGGQSWGWSVVANCRFSCCCFCSAARAHPLCCWTSAPSQALCSCVP